MKILLISCFALVLGFTSCDQEAVVEPASSSEVLELGSYEQLESLLFDLALNAQDNQQATVFLSAEKGFYAELSEVEPGALQSRKQRCKGNGIAFVKCVKKAIDDYGCQVVTGTDDGNYVSNDC